MREAIEIRHLEFTPWKWLVSYPENAHISPNSDIGAFCYIQAESGVVIEDGVQIGSHCSIYSRNTINDTRGKVVIKKNARIGTHSTILPGVTIGAGAFVPAYSLVDRDVGDGERFRRGRGEGI